MHVRLQLQCVAVEVTQSKRPDPHNPGASTPCLLYTYRFKSATGDFVLRSFVKESIAVGDEVSCELNPAATHLALAA